LKTEVVSCLRVKSIGELDIAECVANGTVVVTQNRLLNLQKIIFSGDTK